MLKITLSYVGLEKSVKLSRPQFPRFKIEITMLLLSLLGWSWRWRLDEVISVKYSEKHWSKCKELLSNLAAALEKDTVLYVYDIHVSHLFSTLLHPRQSFCMQNRQVDVIRLDKRWFSPPFFLFHLPEFWIEVMLRTVNLKMFTWSRSVSLFCYKKHILIIIVSQCLTQKEVLFNKSWWMNEVANQQRQDLFIN